MLRLLHLDPIQTKDALLLSEYDTGINRGLGVPASFYHFAFEAGSEVSVVRVIETTGWVN